jgi:hypothetical protein
LETNIFRETCPEGMVLDVTMALPYGSKRSGETVPVTGGPGRA